MEQLNFSKTKHSCNGCKSLSEAVTVFDCDSALLPKYKFCDKCYGEIRGRLYELTKTGRYLDPKDLDELQGLAYGIGLSPYVFTSLDVAKDSLKNLQFKLREKYEMLNHNIDVRTGEFLKADYKINSQGQIEKNINAKT